MNEYLTLIGHAGVALSISFIGVEYNRNLLIIIGFLLSDFVFLWMVFKVAVNIFSKFSAQALPT
jgi:hypothetical protein